MITGATIERGEIMEETADGFVVASYDREGIVSPVIAPIFADDYSVGDVVYFFLFDDGTGKIICPV